MSIELKSSVWLLTSANCVQVHPVNRGLVHSARVIMDSRVHSIGKGDEVFLEKKKLFSFSNIFCFNKIDNNANCNQIVISWQTKFFIQT